jgi:hypothetical protein
MSASKIKGSLLEYIIRRLLTNCGFTKVQPDNKYIFNDRGLNFIHGKGAAHDADVLMNPPIQMPFSYPFRINFECKAHNKKAGLTIIRNALGLRYDINEFEILTEKQIQERRDLRRVNLAITNRARFNYQVGVASVEHFTKDAIEFAANNKIPLISLKWLFPDAICNLFHQITDTYLTSVFSFEQRENLLLFLKGNNQFEQLFTNQIDSHIKTIINSVRDFENRIIIGLLESGDMIFLFSETAINRRYFSENRIINARYHFYAEDINLWTIALNGVLELKFYLPDSIINIWRENNFEIREALNLKQRLFGKLFIFPGNPTFKIINLDENWLNNVR